MMQEQGHRHITGGLKLVILILEWELLLFKNGSYAVVDFSQLKNAKAITVLQIAARRWPIEVFFREAKQHLGLNHLPYRKWPSLRGHIAVRGLLYFLFRRRNATKASMETMPKNSWRLKTPLQRRIFSYFP
jgi:hypothetical protein